MKMALKFVWADPKCFSLCRTSELFAVLCQHDYLCEEISMAVHRM